MMFLRAKRRRVPDTDSNDEDFRGNQNLYDCVSPTLNISHDVQSHDSNCEPNGDYGDSSSSHSDEPNSPILVPEFYWYPVMQDDPYYPHYLDPNTRILPPPNFEENDSSCPNDCWILDSPSKKESPPKFVSRKTRMSVIDPSDRIFRFNLPVPRKRKRYLTKDYELGSSKPTESSCHEEREDSYMSNSVNLGITEEIHH